MSAAVDRRIARIADRQHGNITRQQLHELGLTRRQIAYRVKLGRLCRVHAGVYAVGRPPKTAIERAAAAVLACGEGAALSHYSALALWGWAARWPTRFDVNATRDRRPVGIRVHRAMLHGRDVRRHQGIRVTSPARTLLDCAPLLSDKARTRAVNNARLSKKLRLADLVDVVERFPHHPGAPLLKPFFTTKGGPTRSEWEDAFPAFCNRYSLPQPLMNTNVAGREVDALFVEEKVIVELDSWEFHSSRASFESDRDRDADTLAAGYVTIRITWERMQGRPDHEAVRLHAIVSQRRRRAA